MTLLDIKDEALSPVLAPYVHEADVIGLVLQHPLVYGVPYIPELNCMYNKQLAYKMEHLAEARAASDWHTYVMLHERGYRIPALDILHPLIPDAEFWPLVGLVYTDSENVHQHYDTVSSWLDVPPQSIPRSIMHEDEQRLHANLPDMVTVYRGYGDNETIEGTLPTDWSWTLSWEVAKWFAVRFDRPGYVVKGAVPKDKIMAVFTRRNESEILAWADNVEDKVRLDS